MRHRRIGSFYDLLGVTPNAAPSEIRRAFLVHAQRYHPDLNRDDPQAEWQFKQIRRVYEVLSDPLQRAAYDDYPARYRLDDVGADWNNPATIVTEPRRSAGDPPVGVSGRPSPRSGRDAVGVPWQHNLRTARDSRAALIGFLWAMLVLAIVIRQLPSPPQASSNIPTAARTSSPRTRSARDVQSELRENFEPLRLLGRDREEESTFDSSRATADARPTRRAAPDPSSVPSDWASFASPGQSATHVDTAGYVFEPELWKWPVPDKDWTAPAFPPTLGSPEFPAPLPPDLTATPLPPTAPGPSERFLDPALDARLWATVPVGESTWSAPQSLPTTRPFTGIPNPEWVSAPGGADHLRWPLQAADSPFLYAVTRENLWAGFRDTFRPSLSPAPAYGGGLLRNLFAPPSPLEPPLASPPPWGLLAARFGPPPAAAGPTVGPSTVGSLPSRPPMPGMPLIGTQQPSFAPKRLPAYPPSWP